MADQTWERPITSPYRLNNEDLLYFLHVPKTAGTTVAHLLERRFPPERVCPAHLLSDLARLPRESLQTYRCFWGHLGYYLPDLVGRPMLFVTFLREPVEQLVSFYEFVRRNPHHYLHEKVNRDCPTLAQAVRDPELLPHLRHLQLFHFLWDDRLMPRLPTGVVAEDVRYMVELDERLRALPSDDVVGTAKERLGRYAFVGLTERMDESLELLCRTFCWPPFGETPRLNAAPSRFDRDALPTETRQALDELTRPESELYAYARQLFERRLQSF